MKLIDVACMREVERQADASGLSYAEMLQRAGAGLAGIVEERYGTSAGKQALGLVGTGNNGGDVLVALANMAQTGWQVRAYLAKPRPKDPLVVMVQQAGGLILTHAEDKDLQQLDQQLVDADVILDGLLGTGFELPLKSELREILAHIQRQPVLPHIVAVDCPSGVDCDSGEMAEEVLKAELTVCMGAIKQGLLRFPAFERVGELQVVDLDFADDLPAWQAVQDQVITEAMAGRILPKRALDGHKGTFGKTLLVVGSVNYPGAALLAGKAALRSGVGLVKMAVPGFLQSTLAGHLAEATWVLLPNEMGVIASGAFDVLAKELDGADSLLLGCGWGREATTAVFLKQLLSGKQKSTQKSGIGFIGSPREVIENSAAHLPTLVVDADGLQLLAQVDGWQALLPAGSVLTPHPGELAALSGLSVSEIQADRTMIVRRLAQEWGVVLVLKGALTVIANPQGQVKVLPVATSALAHGGTGDVLAGLISGLLAQGLCGEDAAILGCWLHAQAGLVAEEWAGHAAAVTAGDVVDALGEAFQQLAASQV